MKQHVKCHIRGGQEYPVSPDDLRFRPLVYGLLIKGDKVLLSPQWDGYDFPGGGVNIDESLEEALIREFKEESGLDIRLRQVVYAGTSFFYRSKKTAAEKHWNCPIIYYLVEQVGGKLTLDYAETYEKEFMGFPVWQDIASLESLIFHSGLGQRSPEIVRLAQRLQEKL